jgi:LPS-assembly lipoprotein
MLRSFRTAAVVLLPLLLSACGFGLRGVTAPLQPMPFSSLYLSGGSPMVANLRHILERDGQVALPGKASDAEAVLVIDGENYSKDILTINRSGKINQYQLNYQVDAHVLKKGAPFGPPIEVRAHRDFVYSDQVLGKEQEENFLKDDMMKDVAEQLARRLAYLKPVKQDPFSVLEGQPNAGAKP